MAYNIDYKNSVKRDLKKIDKSEARRILDQLEEDLSDDPKAYPQLKGDFAGLRKYRAGDYRAIFAVIEERVLILRIGYRKDVYR